MAPSRPMTPSICATISPRAASWPKKKAGHRDGDYEQRGNREQRVVGKRRAHARGVIVHPRPYGFPDQVAHLLEAHVGLGQHLGLAAAGSQGRKGVAGADPEQHSTRTASSQARHSGAVIFHPMRAYLRIVQHVVLMGNVLRFPMIGARGRCISGARDPPIRRGNRSPRSGWLHRKHPVLECPRASPP